MTAARRRIAWRRGRVGESVCVAWLILHGYRIIGTRMRSPVGEIDIAARRGRTLAVIEVKVRDSRAAALGSVGRRQQRRLRRAAEWLIAGRTELASLDIRFDVMAVAPWRLPVHVIDAWRTDEC